MRGRHMCVRFWNGAGTSEDASLFPPHLAHPEGGPVANRQRHCQPCGAPHVRAERVIARIASSTRCHSFGASPVIRYRAAPSLAARSGSGAGGSGCLTSEGFRSEATARSTVACGMPVSRAISRLLLPSLFFRMISASRAAFAAMRASFVSVRATAACEHELVMIGDSILQRLAPAGYLLLRDFGLFLCVSPTCCIVRQ
jgi:hypothetical protein